VPVNSDVRQQETLLITTYKQFLAYCSTLEGETLHTLVRPKPFTVVVGRDVLQFVPSSKISRRANPVKTENVLKALAESNDWSPGSYIGMTRHSSYILAVAKHWSERHGATV
jgi:hypothetical protein